MCLQQIIQTDRLTTPCDHRFHKTCISRWTKTKKTCPMCRTRIVPAAIVNGEPITKSQLAKHRRGNKARLDRLFNAFDLSIVRLFIEYYNQDKEKKISINIADPVRRRLWMVKTGVSYTSSERMDTMRLKTAIPEFIALIQPEMFSHETFQEYKRDIQRMKDDMATTVSRFIYTTTQS